MKSNFPDWIQQYCDNSFHVWNWNMLYLIFGNFLSKKNPKSNTKQSIFLTGSVEHLLGSLRWHFSVMS